MRQRVLEYETKSIYTVTTSGYTHILFVAYTQIKSIYTVTKSGVSEYTQQRVCHKE